MAVLILDDRVKVCLDRVCVANFPVGEFHAVTNVECIGLSIITDVPGLRQASLISICRDIYKCLIKHLLGIHFSCIEMRI